MDLVIASDDLGREISPVARSWGSIPDQLAVSGWLGRWV